MAVFEPDDHAGVSADGTEVCVDAHPAGELDLACCAMVGPTDRQTAFLSTGVGNWVALDPGSAMLLRVWLWLTYDTLRVIQQWVPSDRA